MVPTLRHLDNRFDHAPTATTRADPLSDALECLGLCNWLPGQFALTAPWGIRVATQLGWFYMMTRRSCLLDAEGANTMVRVATGDLIVVFQGRKHNLRDEADSPLTSIQALLERRGLKQREPLRHGGSGESTRLFCGCFVLEGFERSPLQTVLPAFIHVKGKRGRALPWVDCIIRLLRVDAAADAPGSQSIINHLVRALLTKALQSYVSELPRGNTDWLSALVDPYIGRAIGLMHARPAARWTVASLAEQVAMSRSTFSARFTGTVGKPPLEYLTDLRMQKAFFLLRTSRAELKGVAAQVGYKSNSAFSKAFTRWAGVAPGVFRRGGDSAADSLRGSRPTT